MAIVANVTSLIGEMLKESQVKFEEHKKEGEGQEKVEKKEEKPSKEKSVLTE